MWIQWGSDLFFKTGCPFRSSLCFHPDTWPCCIQTQDGQCSLLLSLWIGLSLVMRRGLGGQLCPDCCHIGHFVKLRMLQYVVAHKLQCCVWKGAVLGLKGLVKPKCNSVIMITPHAILDRFYFLFQFSVQL